MNALVDYSKAYCEETTLHGFAYFVKAPRLVERILWVAVVIGFATYAGHIIGIAIKDWNEHPTATYIQTYSKVHT